jgi:hypothetical protein
MKKKCPICKQWFRDGSKNKKYCSFECYYEANKQKTKERHELRRLRKDSDGH